MTYAPLALPDGVRLGAGYARVPHSLSPPIWSLNPSRDTLGDD